MKLAGKLTCAFTLWAIATTSFGQADFAGPLSIIPRTLQNQINPAARPQNPQEPADFPPLPSKFQELPPPRAYGPEENVLELIKTGDVTQSGSHIYATGGVHARYKGYDMTAAELDGDTITETYTLRGDADLAGQTSTVHGQRVTVNFRERSFFASQLDADLKPSFFPAGRLDDDIYLKAGDAFGSGKEIFGDYSELTTCNLPDPHFELISKRSDVRPGRRLILWDSQLWILHKHILTIPYLSLPLDDRSNRYTPQFGSDPTAGYYVKFKVPIGLHSTSDFLDARADYYTRLGNGLGLDYDYRNRNLGGLLQLYSILQSKQLDINIHHEELFGPNDLTIDSSYQKNDYLVAPGSTLLTLRGQLTIPEARGSFDQLMFSEQSNNSLGFNSVQQTIGINDSRVYSRNTRSTLNLAYTDDSSSGEGEQAIRSRALDVQFDATSDLNKALAELQYIRYVPIGQNNNAFFSIADETPVATLKTDSTRLLNQKLALELPFQMDFSVGDFGTPSLLGLTAEHVTRSVFDLNFQRPDHPDRKFDVAVSGKFQQGVYSDNAAQYVTGLDTSARYSFGRDTSLNLRYDYLDQHGFTPIEIDRTNPENLLTSDISVRPFHSFLLAAQTGYDFLQAQQGLTPWQDAGIRTEWTPASWFRLRSLATYDTSLKQVSNYRFDLAYKPGATFVGAGFLYDNVRKSLGDVNVFVDGFTWGRLKTSMILDYDGYIHQFNAEHFSFTYDLHCAEAILQFLNNPVGFRPGLQVAFYIRLKAFPFNTPFGVGNRGQAIGSGTGRDFY